MVFKSQEELLLHFQYVIRFYSDSLKYILNSECGFQIYIVHMYFDCAFLPESEYPTNVHMPMIFSTFMFHGSAFVAIGT